MGMSLRRGIVVVGVGLLLGCGGMMRGGRGVGLEKEGAKVMLLPESPQREQVLAVLAEAYFLNQQGEYGTSDIRELSEALKDILADDELTTEEVADLLSGREGWVRPDVLDAERQASFLKFETGVKRRIEAARRQKKRAQARFHKWSYPEDLEARFVGVGIDLDRCRSRISDDKGLLLANCVGEKGEDIIKAEVEEYSNSSEAKEAAGWYEEVATRRDGSFVFSIQYFDRAASEALARAVLAEAPFSKQSLKVIKRAAKKSGFSSKTECSTDKDSDGKLFDCSIRSGHSLATILVDPGERSAEEDSFGIYGFEINHKDGKVRVLVEDPKKAEAVMDSIF